jgi:ribosome-binding ATPase YchF (GTP1/OBG family)
LVTAVVDVRDPRVDILSGMFDPKKTTYARITYSDVAGLQRGEDEAGSAISPQVLNHIAGLDGLVHAVRGFENDLVPHLDGDRGSRRPDSSIAGLGRVVQMQLHSLVRRHKAERLVEALRIRARLVGRQLDDATITLAGAVNRPLKELAANARIAVIGSDADTLNEGTARTLVGQIGDKRQLQNANDRAVHAGHYQLVVRVRLYLGEGTSVSLRQRVCELVAACP